MLLKMTHFINQHFEALVHTHPEKMLAHQTKFKTSDEYKGFMVACNAPKKDLNQLLDATNKLRLLMLKCSGLHTLDFTALEAQRPSPITRNNQWQSAIGDWDVTLNSLKFSGLTPQSKVDVVASFKRQNAHVQEAQIEWRASKLQQQAQQSGQQLRTI
jgi:hypothetical protein